MTSAQRKKRWDQRMRNVVGEEPGQPERTPVVVYLCQEARAVMRQERGLAKATEVPSVRDSELIEGLLKGHAARTIHHDRPGVSLEQLRRHLDVKEVALQAARADLARHVENPVNRNRRTYLRLADLPRALPTVAELAQELKRRNNADNGGLIAKLVRDVRPLFAHAMAEPELRSKLQRHVEAHIERLLGVDG